MHIDVAAPDDFDAQTRAYAEFRLFSALTRCNEAVEHVRVSLQHPPMERDTVVCIVAIAMESGTVARVRARARHAYEAIDRAAVRVSNLLWRQSRVAIRA